VAGESPDKVEREESSGETTDDAGTVASPRGKKSGTKTARKSGASPDAKTAKSAKSGKTPKSARRKGSTDDAPPGDGDDAPGADDSAGSAPAAEDASEAPAADAAEGAGTGQGEGGGRGDERLKTAVAAWVASTGDEPDEPDEAAEAERESPGEGQKKTSQSTAAGSEGAENAVRASTSAGEPEDGVDQPTAMFRTVQPDSGRAEDAEDAEEAARRAERMTSAFFGPGKSGEKGKSDSEGGSGESAASDASEEAEGSEEADRSEETEERAAEPDAEEPEAAEAEPAEEPGTSRVDEPTAVFRTPASGETAKKSAPLDQPTAVFRTVEPDEAEAAAKPAKSVDPRVVVAVGEGGGSEAPAEKGQPEAEPESGTKAEQQTKAEAKAEPEPDAESETDAEPGTDSDSESESERTSQFVPLRSADAPPRPPRPPHKLDDPAVPPKPLGKPEAAPTAGELPPETVPPQLTEAELTRQQARPDQAPLDLLAQLTNTPPPPETPLRTAARRVKIWTPLVMLLAVLFVVAQVVRPLPEAELSLTASPTYDFQGAKPSVPWPSEGQATLDVQGLGSLGSSGKQKPVPIASVAKVMTAYVILRDHPVKKGSQGATIPVDKKAEDEAGLSAQNESTVEVKEGDKISEREAVEALMIASANNVARLLARWDAGSEKAFAKKMNAAAKDLGMTDTKYTDPSGLTSSTVSTAEDQVKLAKKAMSIDLFRKTVRLPGYTDTKGERHGNWNKLVPLDGVVGIKTGTTTRAGGNLLFAAEKEVGGTKQLIVGAVLGQYEPSILDTVLAESKKLIDTAQEALRAQKVVRKGEVVGYVDDQLGGRTPVVATKDVTAVGWSGLKVKLAMTDGGKALPHEGSAGDRAGTLTVGDGPGQVRVPLALKEDMTEPGFGAKLTRIL